MQPGIPLLGQQRQQPVTLMNDVQLVALLAGMQPVNLSPVEAVERSCHLVAESILAFNSGALGALVRMKAQQQGSME